MFLFVPSLRRPFVPANHWLVTTSHLEVNLFVEAAAYVPTIYTYILSRYSLHRFFGLEEQ